MTLPELEWQIVYARIAWAAVLAALAVAALSRRWAVSRTGMVALGVAAALVLALPGSWSPAYWIGLVFQSPSGLTLGLSALALRNRWLGEKHRVALPLPLAVILAVAGALLYLDASGWIALGVYFLGFGPHGAPLAALVLASFCLLAISRRAGGEICYAVFASLALFMLLRLPTGNLWDALIDPFVWVWALLVCVRAVGSALKLRGEPASS